VVDDSRVRHSIPYVQDDVCWRYKKDYKVSATALTFDQAATLDEKESWPCIIGPLIVRSSDENSYLVTGSNEKRWIPDVETFDVLDKKYSKTKDKWPANEVAKLTDGERVKYKIDPDNLHKSIICRDDGVCWFVDSDGVRHHIPTYADKFCLLHVKDFDLARNNLNFEQADSLKEDTDTPKKCSLDSRIITDYDGASYYMDGNTRREIQDVESYWYYVEKGADVIKAKESNHIKDRIGVGSKMPRRLSAERVKKNIVRVNDGTAYFVDKNGKWHWINTSWGCLTKKYDVLIWDATWAQVNTLRIGSETTTATCSM
jgi:hypothetical protein